MRRRRTLVVLALAAVVGLLWLAALEMRSEPRLAADAGADAKTRSSAFELSLPTSEMSRSDSSTPEVSRRSSAQISSAAPAEPAEPRGIFGTVVLVDRGVRNERPNGEFEIRWSDVEGKGARARVPVRDGAWEARLEEFAVGSARRFVLEGRVAAGLRSDVTLIASNVAQALEVWSADAIALHVLDAQTGAELPDVEVSFPILPPFAAVRGASPLVIEPNQDALVLGGAAQLSVDAPGHSSEWIEVSFHGGGDRFVELRRSGDLIVRFVDPFPEISGGELIALSGELVARESTSRESIEFRSRPEGECELVFHRDPSSRERRVLPNRRVRIVGGTSRTEFVESDAREEGEWASIAGSLAWVPVQGGVDGAEVDVPEEVASKPFLAIDDSYGRVFPEVVQVGEPGMWTWSADVAAGPCVFTLDDGVLQRVVRDGERVDLELPPFVEVRVTCRSLDGEPVAVEQLGWRHEAFGEVRLYPGPTADGPAVVLLAVGRGKFIVEDSRMRLVDPHQQVEVIAHGQEIELRVRPAQGVELAFRHGESFHLFETSQGQVLAGSPRVPVKSSWWIGPFLHVELAEAGPVTLSISARPVGFEPIEDFVVDVPKGAFAEHEVRLVPDR